MTAWSGPELVGQVANRAMTDRPLRVRTVPCACGGEITADVTDPGPEVKRHNETLRHRVWWIRIEQAEEGWM